MDDDTLAKGQRTESYLRAAGAAWPGSDSAAPAHVAVDVTSAAGALDGVVLNPLASHSAGAGVPASGHADGPTLPPPPLHTGSDSEWAAPGDAIAVDVGSSADAAAGQPPRPPRKASHVGALDQAEVTLTWSYLTYTIPVKTQDSGGKKVNVDKTIVSNLTGAIEPGQMMAVMGTSGSGKTSFLNLLAGRYSVGTVKGTVRCNGAPRGETYKRSIGYVEQDDLMFANLTVTEMLVYTALLRLPSHLDREDKILRANEVLEQLGLSDCRHTRIGAEGRRGISGGERKRTSIAIELITNPRLLFLDEPSSYTAAHVMETIKCLTVTGRSVVLSIHQPRDKIFRLFDKILLLARGDTCYYGSFGGARDFFAQCGHACPPGENMADWLLDLTTIDTRNEALLAASVETVGGITSAYAASSFRADAQSEVGQADMAGAAKVALAGGGDAAWREQQRLPYCEEFAILASRALKLVTREPKTTKVAVFQAAFLGLLTGVIFFDLGDDQTGVRDRQGFLFFALIGNAFPAITGSVALFHTEKRVFNRERMGGAYHVSTYFLSKSSTDLPIAILPLFVFVGISYFMVGLVADAEVFFKTILMLVITVTCAQSLGLLISASTPAIQVGQAMAPLALIMLIMFGGFYLQVESIPVWLSWIEVFSFFQYAFVGLMRVQFQGQRFTCAKADYCLETGEEVLADMGLDGDDRDYWHEFGKVCALAVGFRFLAYLALRFMYKRTLRFD